MAKVQMFKMPFETNHFNKGQKVWIVFGTGDEAAYVVGRYRANYRYVSAWVKWEAKDRQAPEFKEFEVTDEFALRHSIAPHHTVQPETSRACL